MQNNHARIQLGWWNNWQFFKIMIRGIKTRVWQDNPIWKFDVWVNMSSCKWSLKTNRNAPCRMHAGCILNDSQHTNVADLDANLKGVNMALQWKVTVLHLFIDSACVYGWILDALTEKDQIYAKVASEMLIWIEKLVDQCDLSVDVMLVKSYQNQMDKLSRLLQRWLSIKKGIKHMHHVCDINEQVLSKSNKVCSLPKYTFWHQMNSVLHKTDQSCGI